MCESRCWQRPDARCVETPRARVIGSSELPDMDSGNGAGVLCKSSKRFILSHLFIPELKILNVGSSIFFFTSHVTFPCLGPGTMANMPCMCVPELTVSQCCGKRICGSLHLRVLFFSDAGALLFQSRQ